MAREFMTVADLAEVLQISRFRAYDLIEAEGIPYVRFSERRIRIPRSEFDRWLEGRTVRKAQVHEVVAA